MTTIRVDSDGGRAYRNLDIEITDRLLSFLTIHVGLSKYGVAVNLNRLLTAIADELRATDPTSAKSLEEVAKNLKTRSAARKIDKNS